MIHYVYMHLDHGPINVSLLKSPTLEKKLGFTKETDTRAYVRSGDYVDIYGGSEKAVLKSARGWRQ